MKKLMTAALGLVLLGAAPCLAQIRNVTINAESDEGKLLQAAGEEQDAAKKIALLEEFLSKYGSHDAVGYVHFQLLSLYLGANNHAKALEHGEKALAKAPTDVEVAHLIVKSAEGTGDAGAVIASVERARGLAGKAAAAPKPSDEDAVEGWQRSVQFAKQVDQYNQHALFATAVKVTDPKAKIQLLDSLRKNYPDSQFDKQLDALYFTSYQQLGDTENMLKSAEAALTHDPTNELYLYQLGEAASDPATKQLDKAQSYAQKILESLPNKPKPEGVADDAWAQHKATFMGLARSMLGRALANQGKYGPAYKELLAAAKELKGNDQALAPVYFYLGFSSVKLERPRDAVTYLGQAAKIPGPYQPHANDLLKKVRAALSGR